MNAYCSHARHLGTMLVLAILVALIVIGIAPKDAEGQQPWGSLESYIADSLANAEKGTDAAEPSVQDILDSLGINADAVADLLPNEYFLKNSGCVKLELVAEYSGYSNQSAIGWYYPGQKNRRVLAVPASATPSYKTTFAIDSVDSIGWFLLRGSSILYSQKAYNVDLDIHCKFYATGDPNEYVMFWEDLPFQNSDYNDEVLVFSLPSGHPVVTCNVPTNLPGTACSSPLSFSYQVESGSGDSVWVDLLAPGISETVRVATGTSNTVTYSAPSGIYEVRVIVRDDCGAADTCSQTLSGPENQPPVVTGRDTTVYMCAPVDPCVYYQVTDPNGSTGIVETLLQGPGVLFQGIHVVCFHPDTAGVYTFKVKATDPCGAADTATFYVTIDFGDPPTISLGDDRVVFQCTDEEICLPYVITDPDQLAGLSEQLISGPGDVDTVANQICFTPDGSGSYTFIMQVDDPCGFSDRDTVTVTVTGNDPPVILFGNDTTIARDSSFCLHYTVSDPNGLGGLIEELIAGPPGTLLDTLGNRVCWAPPACTEGQHTFVVKVTDPCNASDYDTIVVTIPDNQPPVCEFIAPVPPVCLPDEFFFAFTSSDPEGGSTACSLRVSPVGATLDGGLFRYVPSPGEHIDVVIACFDPCGDSCVISFSLDFPTPQPPVCIVPNDTTITLCDLEEVCLPVSATSFNPPVTCAVVAGPGTVSGGNWCYTPTGGETVNVTIRCTDACSDFCEGSFSVTFDINQPPSIDLGADLSVEFCNSTAPICISYTVSDPDGLAGLIETQTSGPGTLDTALNQVCFAPDAPGQFTIVVRVEDSCDAFDLDTVVVTVTSQAPPACVVPNDTIISQCSPQQICLPVSATGPNPPYLCRVDSGQGTIVDGNWCYTPAAPGVYVVKIVCGNECDSCVSRFSVDVRLNLPPSIAFGTDASIFQCSPSQVCFPYVVSDPDGLAGLVETLVNGPLGGSLDSLNNRVCFTPAASGAVTFIVRVADPCGLEDIDTINIAVNVDDPPVINVGADTSVFFCNLVPICRNYTVSDPNGLGKLIESLIGPPAGVTLDTAQNRICYLPTGPGTVSIVARVADSCERFDLDTFAITVDVNDPPTIGFGVDDTVTQCSPTQICLNYTVSDPDGLAALREQLVSGPIGTAIDTVNNRVCFTPATSGTFSIIVRDFDACGLLDQDTIRITVQVNLPPLMTAGPDTTVSLCASGPICIGGIVATDPNGGPLTIAQTAGPGTYDPIGHTLCFTPVSPGTTCFEFTVTDECGATDKDSVCVTVNFNQAPSIDLGNVLGSLIFTEPTQLCFDVNASDPNAGQLFTVTQVEGAGSWAPANGRNVFAGQHCFMADTSGCYRFIFDVTDSCGLSDRDTLFVCLAVNVPDDDFRICLDTVSAINGSLVTVHAYATRSMEMGGFDMMVCWDETMLSFITAFPDSLIEEWEYFTYRLGAMANCAICPPGVIRILAVADMNNGPSHPPEESFFPRGNLFGINFYLTVDRTFIGMCAPITFCSMNCSDNAISSRSGDTLFISYDQGDSCLIGDKYHAIRQIEYCPGLVCVVPPEDDRGDINLNGLANEIGDAVLYTNYFIYGPSVWNPTWRENQILASDVNCDGIVLTIADLIRLIRIITGDDQPTDCPDVGVGKIASSAGNAEITLVQVGDRLEGWIDTDAPLAGVFVNFDLEGAGVPSFDWSDEIGGLDTLVRFNRGEMRALAVDKNSDSPGIPRGKSLLFTATVPSGVNLTVKESQAATPDGDIVTTEIVSPAAAVPTRWTLEQNYPNPFNAGTVIRFGADRATDYEVAVFDILGRRVWQTNGHTDASWVAVPWNGHNDEGQPLASGIYIYRVVTDSGTLSKKMTLLK